MGGGSFTCLLVQTNANANIPELHITTDGPKVLVFQPVIGFAHDSRFFERQRPFDDQRPSHRLKGAWVHPRHGSKGNTPLEKVRCFVWVYNWMGVCGKAGLVT